MKMKTFRQFVAKKDTNNAAKNQLRAAARKVVQMLTVQERTVLEVLDRTQSQDETAVFWSGAYPQFDAWLQSQGVTYQPGVTPTYKDGGDGRAYFVGDKVVKFTRDRVCANVSSMAIGNTSAPTPVIAVWRVPAKPLWAILMHRVDPDAVSKEASTAADCLMGWLDEDENAGLEHFPTGKGEQERMAQQICARYKKPASLVPIICMVMDTHNQLYFSTGFRHDDAGGGNMAVMQVPQPTGTTAAAPTRLVYHDLGPNMTKEYRPRKTLDQIHATRGKLNLPGVEEI